LDASITTRPKLSAIIAGVIDVVAVVVFVVIGQRNHDGSSDVYGIINLAAPFLIALLTSWVLLRTWRGPFNRASFVATWVITVAGGLFLRRVVFDRGIATAFIIVTVITLGLLLGLGRLLSRKLSAKTSQ
jgi:hypothetical protein